MAKKLALLVGCNYSDNPNVPEGNRLHGCINDVNAMQTLICQPPFGFKDENITILTDKPGMEKAPTSSNIIEELKTKVNATKPGDTLLFFFSGGGELVNPTAMDTAVVIDTNIITVTVTGTATATATKSATATATASPTAVASPTAAASPTGRATPTADTKKGSPAIIPSDLFPITAADILPIINPLPDKAIFIFVSDSSYSGGLFDNKVQIKSNVPDPEPNLRRRKTIPSNLLRPSNVGGKSAAGISLNGKILISSSKANEESVEVYPDDDKSKAFGAFSNFIRALTSPEGVNDPWVLAFDILRFNQHPYLDFLGNVA